MANRKTPYIVRERAGNPGKRKHSEPWARPGTPKMPAGLPAMAQRHWKWLVGEMDGKDLLSTADAGILEAACRAYSKARTADKVIDRQGLTMDATFFDQKSQTSRVIGSKTRPEVAISKSAWAEYRTCLVELQATPKSRGGVTTKSSAGDLDAALDDDLATG